LVINCFIFFLWQFINSSLHLPQRVAKQAFAGGLADRLAVIKPPELAIRRPETQHRTWQTAHTPPP